MRLFDRNGFGLVEMIVAIGLWIVLISSGSVMLLGGLQTNRLAGETAEAGSIAAEGLDAVKAIKKQGWTTPFLATNCVTGCGLATVSGTWAYAGTNNVIGKYTRQVFVNPVNRDGTGNIVTSGGSVDSDTYLAKSTVTWSPGGLRSVIVSAYTYLTNYVKSTRKGGILVYGDGGTTTDAIKYQTVDGSGTWSAAASTADVDGATTNKVLQAVRVFASPTRNEKVIISRHYDGTNQYIYGQVYNGSSWGNVQILSNWTANTFMDVRNFDGTYLANGNFMAVYSDNTNVPKMNVWNGSSWSGSTTLTSLGAANEIPSFVRVAARPGTNEVMAAFFTQALDTITEYWSGSAWSAITSHATNGFNANNQEADFAWSSNTTTIGAIIYVTAGGDKTPRVKLFQANGSGGGTWGSQVNGSPNFPQASRSMVITARPGANEFQACYKDQQGTPDITCREITFSGTVASIVNPTNSIIVATSVSSTNPSFDMEFEASAAAHSVIVYSDNTNVPQLKKYVASTSTWDSAATAISTSPYTLGTPVQSVKIAPLQNSNDLMIVLADNNMDLYSVEWDGTNNTMYTTPAGQAFLQHGVNGSAVTNFWYDFSWDNF